MTNEEAIKILDEYGALFPNANGEQEAIDIAIAALKKRKPYESKALKPCKCGSKLKPENWVSSGCEFYQCCECGFKSTEAKTNIKARRNWNREVSIDAKLD